jgi:hypothetical protein
LYDRLEQSGHGYLLKPFRPDELVSLAIEVMQKVQVKCAPIHA